MFNDCVVIARKMQFHFVYTMKVETGLENVTDINRIKVDPTLLSFRLKVVDRASEEVRTEKVACEFDNGSDSAKIFNAIKENREIVIKEQIRKNTIE